MVIMAPADENECRQMLYTGHKLQKPVAVRYPRGSATGVIPEQKMTALEIGKSRTIRTGEKVAILNFGILLPYTQEAAEKINATVIDMRFVKPLDTEIINQLAAKHDLFVSIEDGAIMGGAGSAVAEYLMSSKHSSKLLQLGLPDEFIMQGTQQEMYAELGLDAAGILARICDFYN
jgi:1-deoxy-D-xylulose-5-phosphate synthase